MIDDRWHEVWIRLAERCAEIRRLREEREAHLDPVRFVYDSNDQASLAR